MRTDPIQALQAPNEPLASEGKLRSLFLILAAAAALMGALLALLPAAGHDQLWFILMARRWLSGATLYGPEIFDSNPPAVVWASALPIRLGDLFHLRATLPAKILVLLLEAATAWLSMAVLRLHRPSSSRAFPAGLLFAYVVLTVVLPARDFGQRDQLLSFLILPYVLAVSLDPALHRLTSLRAAAGLLAAIGLCLKPQYTLIPLVLETSLLIRSRARLQHLLRPESVILCLIGAAYLTAIHHFTPLYFTDALPILRQTYWAVGHLTLSQLALEAIELLILALAAMALFCAWRVFSPSVRNKAGEPQIQASPRALPATLLIAATAALIAYLIQGTGWYYQQLPALVLFGAALAIQLLDLLDRRQPRIPGWLLPFTTALCVFAIALTTHFMGYPFTPDRAFAITEPDPSFFIGLAPGTPVAMLTTSVDDAMMPIERYHLTWAQRTNNLWLLPAILRNKSGVAGRHQLPPAELANLEDLQHRWMVEDLQRWKPQLILVQRCYDAKAPAVHCQLLEDRRDDPLAWFERDPDFTALWRSYRFQRRSGPFDAYILNSTGGQ